MGQCPTSFFSITNSKKKHYGTKYFEETESLEETLFADELIGAKPASQETVL
jgi:hypothetical protein